MAGDEADGERTLVIAVRALHCPGCVARLARVLELQPGVARAVVNFLSGHARVALTPDADADAVRAALWQTIDDAGFVAVRAP